MEEGLTKAQKIVKTCDQLHEIRLPRVSTWEDIIKYVLPGLELFDINSVDKPGKRQGGERYDGTGVSALQLFASGLFGYLVSPNLNWLRFRMRDNELGEMPEVRKFLQNLEDHFYALFSQTNFYEAVSMIFERGPAFGFAPIYSEEDLNEGKIVFSVPHPGETYIAQNKYGVVDTIYRRQKMDIGTMIEKWGKGKFTEIELDAAGKDPFAPHKIIHAVYPRKGRDGTKKDNLNMLFESAWVVEDMNPKAGGAGPRFLGESGYKMNPWHVWRFKPGVTPYGSGPAEDALVEVMGANTVQRTNLLAAEKSVNPPYNVPSELEGKININPRGFTYYTDPKRIPEPSQTGINYPIGKDEKERLKAAIEDHFNIGFFTLLAQYEGQPKTATEIIELQGEKAAVLGRPINSLNNQCLNPIIDRIFEIELNAGRLPEIPGVLLELGVDIEVDYMGPLAQAQKKLHETQGIRYGLEQIAGLESLYPGVKKLVKKYVIGRRILRTANFPQDAIEDQAEIDKMDAGELQAMQKANAQEEMEGLSKNVKTLAEADKATEGKIMGAMGGEEAEAA